MKPRLPPKLLLADMRRAGIEVPAGGEYLGARIEGSVRVLLWRLGDGGVTEQRVYIYNAGVEQRRKGLRLVR